MNDRKGWLYRLSILRKEILFGMISLYKIIKRTQYKLTLLACFAPLQREVYNNAIIVFGPEPVELRWIIFLIGKNQIRWIAISDIETQFCPPSKNAVSVFQIYYFLLPWKIPKEFSRRLMLFHN